MSAKCQKQTIGLLTRARRKPPSTVRDIPTRLARAGTRARSYRLSAHRPHAISQFTTAALRQQFRPRGRALVWTAIRSSDAYSQGNTEIKSARKGALIRGKLPNRGGRDHSLLARQFKSELRRCSRSRASAFYRSGATPRDLPPCFGDYRAYRHRCVFQSSPQTSCFTPAHFSESGQSQTPVGNGCFALAQGRQSRSSQAPVAG